MRCWINPVSEPDVKFVAGIPIDGDDEPVDADDPDGSAAGAVEGDGRGIAPRSAQA
ncbi:hypothetical protein [Dactylosporangium sp. CA-233914]|uniref:hypothetical protein n=1 Tax=Dactylosporangium sp. CA-233914 TaxID=3239934 RepID=UPI003D933C1A